MSISAVAAVTKWSQTKKSHRLLMLCLAQSADQSTFTTDWIGISCIAERSGYCQRQVKRLIADLVAMGELEVIIEGDGGNPSYCRSPQYTGCNGRGRANAYRLTLTKGDRMAPFSVKGDNLSRNHGKGDKYTGEKVTNRQIKGDIAMSPQSNQRITEGGGDPPPAPPQGEVGADGASARAAPPPQAEPEADAKARRMAGRLTSLEKMLIAGRRWMVAEDGALVKMKAI